MKHQDMTGSDYNHAKRFKQSQSRVIEKAKFTYPSLEKYLENKQKSK